MHLFQIILLALIQGAAELLPVSSSAHVIVAEKLMGLDPSAPEMTFLLVMLHTGTMFAVMIYFWPRWRRLKRDFLAKAIAATAVTGIVGLGLKKFIEKVILTKILGQAHGEIEHLFKSLPLIAACLFSVGILIIIAGRKEGRPQSLKATKPKSLSLKSSLLIGLVQALCLPFRGFSRSGATISVSMLIGIPRATAEDFSFALAVLVTPAVIALQLIRLIKGVGGAAQTGAHSVAEVGAQMAGHLASIPETQAATVTAASLEWLPIFLPGLLGMVFSFISGYFALKWLSRWLEMGRWKYFGFYCIFASAVVLALEKFWF